MASDKKSKLLLITDIILCLLLVIASVLFWLQPTLAGVKEFLIGVGLLGTAIVVVNAIQLIFTRRLTVEFLASIALVASLVEGEWLSVALINLMIIAARIFARYVSIRSHSAIASLLKIRPVVAKIEKDGKLVEIPIAKIKAGDLVIAELGDKIAVDGKVVSGTAAVNQASLTGESLPVDKKAGDEVYSSTVVSSGSLVIRAEKIGADTTFEKIIKLVEESQGNKAPIHALGDIFAKWYIVLTLVLATAVFLLTKQMSLVLALLLVSCADDIAVATPLALSSAIVHASKHGAIIKGSDYLEGLAKVDTMIFDKTGTLTRGLLKVAGLHSFLPSEEKTLLEMAAWAAAVSHHPVAEAVSHYAIEQGLPEFMPTDFKETSGEGVASKKGDNDVLIGRVTFLEEQGVVFTAMELKEVEEAKAKGYNILLVGLNKKPLGFVILADHLRPGLKGIMTKLKKAGIKKLVMLTGDNEKIAGEVAGQIGITDYHANLLPKDKLAWLKKYLNKKTKVAMVGDGVNDAPVLTLADIGIAMGTIGSPAAIDAADIALMKDDLAQLPELVNISRSTLRVIYQNLIIWGAVNVIGMVLVFSGVIGPTGAAAYNFLTDFLPIFNSLRLFNNLA